MLGVEGLELRCNSCETVFESGTNIVQCPNCGEKQNVVSMRIYNLRQKMQKQDSG
jgi:Zn finger protein HypA/HybF involved in hydrogenase expression